MSAPEPIELFIPCSVDQFRPSTGLAMAALLELGGREVKYNPEQTCCGGIPYQAGHWKEAQSLGIRFMDLFRERKFIVTPSPDCAIMVTRHYHELFFNSAYHLDFKKLNESVFEFCDYWVNELGNPALDFFLEERAVVHDACAMGSEYMHGTEFQAILSHISGLETFSLPHAHSSCGRGGLFSWHFGNISTAITKQFLDAVQEAGASLIIGTEPACLIHLDKHIKLLKLPLRTLHITELLQEALRPQTSE